MTNQETMRNLINFLNYHTKKYLAGEPEIEDTEWDNKYLMLRDLERSTNIVYPDSPTQHLYFETVDSLRKFDHGEYPMLSLDKTKSLQEFQDFIGTHESVLSAKMDGLSCKLCYLDGVLVSAATRGNGVEGEDITHNARVLQNVPLQIPIENMVIVTGEVICEAETFKQFADEFKNPRNFAAGAIRLLNSKESAMRHLSFYAWDLVNSDAKTYSERMRQLIDLGFTPAPFTVISSTENLESTIYNIREDCAKAGLPIDGVVVRYNDIAYGNSLGETSHHPRHSFAFKFEDEVVESTLEDIEFEPSRNGIMTPVAIFTPVDLLGSTVSRASLHNISIMKQTLGDRYWRGQKIGIIKSNMIIPQIVWAEPVPEYEGFSDEPDWIYLDVDCPYCGRLLTISTSETGVETLVCNNEHCPSRINNQLDYFCGKTGFDIKGLSKATLDKLVDWGWVEEKADIFTLAKHRDEWIQKPGFGPKSVDNILNAIESRRTIDLPHFIASFGIPGIGLNVAKELCTHIHSLHEFYQIMDGTIDCTEWDGFGRAKRNAIMCAPLDDIQKIAACVQITEPETVSVVPTELTVVITGKLKAGSRANVKKQYEAWGVKVSDSVSSKTNYLIANAPETSAKYKKAQELNIPIVTEEEFVFEILKK